ncbi:MAG: diguanylate cyclase [Halieaceae bacterium]|nr:diguanylate cyclase [Halieaceae bacterium]
MPAPISLLARLTGLSSIGLAIGIVLIILTAALVSDEDLQRMTREVESFSERERGFQRETLNRSLESRARTLSELLIPVISQPLATGDVDAVVSPLETAVQVSGFAYVRLVDATGEEVVTAGNVASQDVDVVISDIRHRGEYLGSLEIGLIADDRNATFTVTESRLDVLSENIHEHSDQARRRLILAMSMSGVLVLLGVIVMLVVNARSVTIPLARLSNWFRQIDAGNYSNYPTVSRQDEIGQLFGTGAAIQERLKDSMDVAQDSVDIRRIKGEVELMHRLSTMLAACSSINEAQGVVAEIIPRLLGEYNGAVSLIQDLRNVLEVKLDWGGMWPGNHVSTSEDCWALRKGKHHLAIDDYVNLQCDHMAGMCTDQTLCIPLIAHGSTIGMMHLTEIEQNPTDQWMRLTFAVAEILGLALANLDMQEKLREQAVRDPLSGLHNRRYLDEVLTHTLMRAQRHHQAVSLLMLDLDHFKRFNDTFGHDAGDYVLQSLSSLISGSVRGEDISCRIGGEEFVVVLPDTGGEGAEVAADKLCASVRGAKLNFNGQSLGNLTPVHWYCNVSRLCSGRRRVVEAG